MKKLYLRIIFSGVLALQFMLTQEVKGSPKSKKLSPLHTGVGYSTAGSGRTNSLALDLGYLVHPEWMISGMMTGAASSAYYYSEYSANLLMWRPLLTNWLGRYYVGYGGGMAYSQKGMLLNRSSGEESVDTNFIFGPSFRVEYHPRLAVKLFVAVEFCMGLGIAFIGNGWGDVGQFSVGVRF